MLLKHNCIKHIISRVASTTTHIRPLLYTDLTALAPGDYKTKNKLNNKHYYWYHMNEFHESWYLPGNVVDPHTIPDE